MNKADGQRSTKQSSGLIDLLVEYRIKLDAMEHVLKEINPLVHEFYVGTIENLQAKNTAELRKAITRRLDSEPAEG